MTVHSTLVAPSHELREAWMDCRIEWGPGLHEDGSAECTYRWIVEGERVLGGVALRHDGHELADRFGHIGYGVRPSERGRGVASWAVREVLRLAADLGMTRVAGVCEVGNAASTATLERAGGQRVDCIGSAVRFWIPVP